ncbi:phage protein [Clostridium sporogenes PA 3679]|uniref:phage major capsid protein n=1 Tax=Clostridium sporogenes TaxID=1509 RepID=UPI00024BA2A9|nr:phage major capsid protein [Clostridium sporogenes]EHN17134.1 phage protein [Clostridium sporogenes PA 3679]
MKLSDELKQELQGLQNEAKSLINKEGVTAEDINNKSKEIETLKAKITMQENIEEEERKEMEDKINNGGATPLEGQKQENKKEDYKKIFFNGLRNKTKPDFQNSMSEGSNTDGGYTVPQDIQTTINELRESKDALQNYITIEIVNTLSGSRVFKTRAQQTGFAEVDENGAITEKATPQFTQLPYSVKKYAGFMKATNELLKDSDQAITSTLSTWVGDESRVTRNKLILAELNKKAKTALAGIDDIKTVINVTLDPVFRNTSSIITNQSGFDYLDKLKDSDNNYLLQPSVYSPTGIILNGLDIIIVSNKDLPNDTTSGTKAPVIIGDLKEAIIMFQREGTSIMASDVAGDAYLTDVTLFRAIERLQVVTKDSEAFVYGQVTIA